MSTAAILEELVTPSMPLEAAAYIAKWRVSVGLQAKFDELASKSSAGTLTTTESAEYAAFIDGMNAIGILQARARAVLNQASHD